ncbi:non-homologous end-joining DNA ligase [Mucilaginibacter sabulilitoris]|uniref:Non-homologous end-joining DNA ligase n=1 Tax=Mucilaginibacter sabulilitoris TaxID=1173583 RepID=A0ABZ0TDV6_9SPHI|nr:non-homologous end-joining DNA ligase [Mucilaginibacter sabulilitoris]WPU90924.1 non-homologous end-joining DNA ligase [Mucilaginibacter sabulilitoris]
MRIDKSAQEATTGNGPANTMKHIAKTASPAIADSSPVGMPIPKDSKETADINFDGHKLTFTHLNKFFWPYEGITKRDMVNFYFRIADFILPYLKDRPMSLNRFPEGIMGPHFYQKDVTGKAPEWARMLTHDTIGGKRLQYFVGSDMESLLWMAGQGCVEMNPWFSRINSQDRPDYCVIDLDPDDRNTLDQVMQVAQTIKKVLDALDVPSFPKMSGSTGIHIFVPLGAKYFFDQSQMFARIIAKQVQKELPDITTLERVTSSRHGKIYLDFLQNREEATIVAPYSLRPKPGATVSMPVHWDELKPGLKMRDFTILNSIDRLKETGDLFKGVLGHGINLGVVIKKAQRTFG